ncbi:hypothetical protein PR202_gb12956 [Eleusine coracana subsp. coracana]|uniref:Uncharacterized protein n=1 Tax=Eleusine coracana subsp. coracana TaxID=191504 RepID=A0AAV5ERV6_ELECO|nr:hypothetical protein PR202_gb12956 [Eleusine coracana subsp. coracana]
MPCSRSRCATGARVPCDASSCAQRASRARSPLTRACSAATAATTSSATAAGSRPERRCGSATHGTGRSG